MDYYKYIKSYERKTTRLEILKYYNNKCIKCWETNNLHVHHINYSALWDELANLETVCVLCKDCHKEHHNIKVEDVEWYVENKQSFYRMTRNPEIWDKILKICWWDRKHLLNLLVFMNSKNVVNWDKIWVKKTYLPQLKMKFSKYWVVKRLKLEWDIKYKYYLNPILSSYWRKPDKQLILWFKDINILLWFN